MSGTITSNSAKVGGMGMVGSKMSGGRRRTRRVKTVKGKGKKSGTRRRRRGSRRH